MAGDEAVIVEQIHSSMFADDAVDFSVDLLNRSRLAGFQLCISTSALGRAGCSRL